MNKSRLGKIFSAMGKVRILVIGDIMLDRYLWGAVSRISPEAPVPVVEIQNEEHLLGGAANVAMNIAALGGRVRLAGIIGKDEFGKKLCALARKNRLAVDGVFIDDSRPTTVKTRIIAHNQQVVRADREKRDSLSSGLQRKMLAYVARMLPSTDAVVISDYGKGVIDAGLVAFVTAECKSRGIFVAVDPKETNFYDYKQVSTITPNHHEAGFVAGRKIVDDRSLEDVGWMLLERLEAESILITLGEKGMALFENNRSGGKAKRRLTRIPTMARKVFDVTGAGDTVIAVMTLAAAAGGSLKEAAFIANVAAGEVVAEIGTAQVDLERLRKLTMERAVQAEF